MAVPKLDLDLFEDSILDSCWKVGGRVRKSHSWASFHLDRKEIVAVDIVACCKQITSLIEENTFRDLQLNQLERRNKRSFIFRDIARLTFGVADIYRCQVDILLGDTKLLLDQMKRTNLGFVLTTTKSVVVKEAKFENQRKRVTTKKSKITLSKRPRLEESELLNQSSQEYYGKLLSECQLWQTEYTQKVEEDLDETIEAPRSCTQAKSYHAITMTEEINVHEDQSQIMPSDGFGDDEELDLTMFQELFPKNHQRTALKRLSVTEDPIDILPDKMPRLDGVDIFQADNAIMTQIYPHNIESADVTQICCEPEIPYILEHSKEITCSQPKNPLKRKLIVDKRIEFTREQLVKQRHKYLDELNCRAVMVKNPSKRRETPNELLCKLNNNLFSMLLLNGSSISNPG
ncbi:uncharacterized protein LOC108034200 isoform X2 [Drosophila biarmipes]|uniref:uncharacterized protein LOC108034200 isoform X2 n=1 Tax=Drosophila biarmipes TaxID=125945 RepID=UPI001CDB10EC|nr:uncharacterized protein LOC108034200 isoform X2 [Drosophila biarmipes]